MAAPEDQAPATANENNPPVQGESSPQEQPILPPLQNLPSVPPVCELRRNVDLLATNFDELRETVQPDHPKGFFLWDFLKDFLSSGIAWRVFKGFLALLVVYKLAFEFELVGSLKDYWEYDWASVRDYFYAEDY